MRYNIVSDIPQLVSQSTSARNSDRSHIAQKICELVSGVRRTGMVYDFTEFPLPVDEQHRGWEHLQFGQLLLPLRLFFDLREESNEPENFM